MRSKLLLVTIVSMLMGAANAWSASLQAPGLFYIKSVQTGKYVVLQYSQLADITADESSAEIITVDYTLQDNGEGIVTTLKNANGDMMATLDFIKESFQMALESEGMETDYLDEMFTLHLVLTGDDDGSVYLCVDVPEIEDFDNIRNFLMEASGYQQAIVYYLSHMVPGNRHYLAVDYDDSFGFRVENDTDCKWLMIPFIPTAIENVEVDNETKSPAYDLQGRKLAEPTGIYIQNGKIHIK